MVTAHAVAIPQSRRPAAMSLGNSREAMASKAKMKNGNLMVRSLRLTIVLKTDGLSGGQSTGANDGAVNSGVVLIRANNRLQHLRSGTSRIWIEVDHRATNIAHRDAHA